MQADSTIDIFNVWRPARVPILERVLNGSIPVTLLIPNGLTGTSLTQQFTGEITQINGNQVIYHVYTYTTIAHPAKNLPTKKAGKFPNAAISFNLTLRKPDGTLESVVYTGEAAIMDVSTSRDGTPFDILLRIPHGFSTQILYHGERYLWKPELNSVIALEAIPKIPETKDALKDILARCVNPAFEPSIVDISPSDICLTATSAFAKISTNPHYFFLLTVKESTLDTTCIFIAKKIGLHYAQDGLTVSGIRLKFQYELNRNANQAQLKWIDVDANGSKTLRTLLEHLDLPRLEES